MRKIISYGRCTYDGTINVVVHVLIVWLWMKQVAKDEKTVLRTKQVTSTLPINILLQNLVGTLPRELRFRPWYWVPFQHPWLRCSLWLNIPDYDAVSGTEHPWLRRPTQLVKPLEKTKRNETLTLLSKFSFRSGQLIGHLKEPGSPTGKAEILTTIFQRLWCTLRVDFYITSTVGAIYMG